MKKVITLSTISICFVADALGTNLPTEYSMEKTGYKTSISGTPQFSSANNEKISDEEVTDSSPTLSQMVYNYDSPLSNSDRGGESTDVTLSQMISGYDDYSPSSFSNFQKTNTVKNAIRQTTTGASPSAHLTSSVINNPMRQTTTGTPTKEQEEKFLNTGPLLQDQSTDQ